MTWCIWPPRQKFTGAFCHVTPVLNDILDLCRFDLMYLTPPPKFHRCILSRYTCVKWYFRSMQIWLDVFDPPPPLKFHRCNLLHYTCVKWYFRSMQIWLDIFDPPPSQHFMDAFCNVTPQPFNQSASSRSRHNKNHMLLKRSTMLKSISCLCFNCYLSNINILFEKNYIVYFSVVWIVLGKYHHIREISENFKNDSNVQFAR